MNNTQRVTMAMVATIILIGMMFSTGPSLILWIPIIGLYTAAVTGKCAAEKVAELILDKLNIPR